MTRLLCLLLLLPLAAIGQPGFPAKTIRLISGVSPGSASDTMARVLSEKLAASLGQPVIVENRLGAGGAIAAKYVAGAEPDGHTISVYTSAFTIAPLLNPGTLDPAELIGLAPLGTVPTVLVVNPAKGYRSVADLVAAAKARPGELVAVNAGTGSSTHMNLERFRLAAGVQFLNLPMKGVPEAVTEVVTGRADLHFAPVFAVLSHIKDGRLQPLAVGSPGRTRLFAELPTTVEAGYASSDYNFWIGALVSARTPRELVQRLNREFGAALAQPDVQDRMQKLGVEPLNLSQPAFDAMLRKELSDNAELVKRAGIRTN